MAEWQILPGRVRVLGAMPEAGGVNFALYSAHAERVDLCLIEGGCEARLTLPSREGDIWAGFVPGLGPGAEYGFRLHGPWAPERGHLFDAAKLLLDPYAREVTAPFRWRPELMERGRDSAPFVPRGRVSEPLPGAPGPRRPWAETVIYEAHVKGLTERRTDVPEADRGRFRGVAAPAMLAHYQRLGITTVELLPVHAFIDDRFVVERGLSNYWGYQSLGFFAPDPRYGSAQDFREMVAALHGAGIELILDVVYNHTGEGDAAGPTLSLRGIDNASYYQLGAAGAYVNDTGCGNTLKLAQPPALRLVMDSLRHWAMLGVDGFRFDLATTLGRGPEGGFDPEGAFLTALRQDPVLAGLKLIAEPWDLGHGGYQLGHFPPPMAEWNDRFRDGVRRFWRGDAGVMPDLAHALAGSARQFDKGGRAPWASVNYLASHDGFTLQDLVSYRHKHNAANGEGGRDGHGENHSDNLGHEGPSADAALNSARGARKRAMLATLFLSQGTPMLLAGDEIGQTQGGNNNAYALDNETTWLGWPGDAALAAFVARLAALRAANPVLRQAQFLHGRLRADGRRDLVWRLPLGAEPTPADWHDPARRCLCLELRGAAEAGKTARAAFAAFNAGGACEVALPAGRWRMVLDSARPDAAELAAGGTAEIAAQSVQLFLEEP